MKRITALLAACLLALTVTAIAGAAEPVASPTDELLKKEEAAKGKLLQKETDIKDKAAKKDQALKDKAAKKKAEMEGAMSS